MTSQVSGWLAGQLSSSQIKRGNANVMLMLRQESEAGDKGVEGERVGKMRVECCYDV